MPLPTLHPENYEPTGISLPMDEYFDPSKNPYFRARANSDSAQAYVSMENLVKLAKTFATDECLEELLPSLASFGSGAADTKTYSLYRMVYDALPEGKKHLIFFTFIIHDSSTPQGVKFKLIFWYPMVTGYNEIIRDLNTSYFYVQDTNGVFYTQTDVNKTALETNLVDISTDINNAFAVTSHQKTYDEDENLPYFIRQVLRYSRDAKLFYPFGSRDQCPISWDWTTPSELLAAQVEGARVSVHFSTNRKRLDFKALAGTANRRLLSRVLSYSTNVFDHLPYTIKGPKEPKALTYGVELEACGDYTPTQLIDAQKDLFFIMKQDGSIFGDRQYCYELVTVPASLKAHKRLWAEFFEKVDYQLFDTSKNTGNGMHVHIDRKAFTHSHLTRFTWFITNPGNEDFILAISERPTKKNLDEWASRPNHHHFATKIQASKYAASTNEGIRGAVHFKRNQTVEVRLFKGIVSYATIVKNLEFVDSVYYYTQQTMLSQMNLRSYIDWLNATPKNKYQMLKAFISEIKIEDMIASADVSDYVWKENRDYIVVEKLNKAPFKITNTHITALNKKRRKRTYVLKSGKVVCVAPTGGLLAKLDKSVQQKQTRGAATFSMTNYAA